MNKRRPRLIPLLLLDDKRRLVKTVSFGERIYIGDPFNVVRLFNEKEVDELCILDIDATRNGREPDTGFLKELVSECFMPVAYGGGINNLRQCLALNYIGIEKMIIGTAAQDTTFITDLSRELGSQAVVACIDVVGTGTTARCTVRSAQLRIDLGPVDYARRLADAGAGEILLQSVDRDGCRCGMDLDTIERVTSSVSVPVIAAGGARHVEDLLEAVRAGASAAASGSAFCFIGRLRAVLVTYPIICDPAEKNESRSDFTEAK